MCLDLIMEKKIQAHWQLQARIDEIVQRLAPDYAIIPVVQNDDDRIMWDEECKGFGRSEWYVGYIVAPNDRVARDLIPSFKKEIDRLRGRYDLGHTCNC
jgi:hypothetical protein